MGRPPFPTGGWKRPEAEAPFIIIIGSSSYSCGPACDGYQYFMLLSRKTLIFSGLASGGFGIALHVRCEAQF